MIRLPRSILLLTLVGLALFFAPQIQQQESYVLIAVGNLTIEGTIVQMLTALVTAAIVVLLIWHVGKLLLRTVVFPSKWWKKRFDQTHANYFQAGIDFMALNQWHLAAEQFLKVKRLERIPLAQQLALVCATQAGDIELSNQLNKRFNLPEKLNNEGNDFHISEINSLLNDGETKLTAERLQQLLPSFNKQSLPLKIMWLEQQVVAHNWASLNKQLLKVEQRVQKELDSQHAALWREKLEQLLKEAFSNFISNQSVNQLQQVFNGWSKSLQQYPPVSAAYIFALAEHKHTSAIETLLLNKQKDHHWLLTVLRQCYMQIGKTPFNQLFVLVQKKLTKTPKDKTLLTIYAYLASGQKDHQLAKQVLEQVVFSNNNLVDTKLYADELALLGEVRHSVEVYQSLYQLEQQS